MAKAIIVFVVIVVIVSTTMAVPTSLTMIFTKTVAMGGGHCLLSLCGGALLQRLQS